MIIFDKIEIKKNLSIEQIYDIIDEFGGAPEYTDFGILSATICHNPIGEGSKKLYYYSNSKLFQCYSNCGSFDIFELVMKVFKIQKRIEIDLNEAVRWVASKFNIAGHHEDHEDNLSEDWNFFANYNRIQELELNPLTVTLKEYDTTILKRLNYTLKLTPWLKDGISQDAIDNAIIGYYPGGDQITIPHFDKDGRFVGLRGRSMCAQESELYGKYRPLIINKQLYNHPLGMNLYNLNRSKDNIAKMKKAIIFESEKSVLQFQSMLGFNADVTVACCGSNVSAFQMQQLIDCGANEITIAFDRQFQEIGDEDFKKLKTKLMKLYNKYKNYALISIIFDKNMITGYKASPTDEGVDKFMALYNERIIL